MKTLILMRHAKAVRPWEAQTDRDRGLTSQGHVDALKAAKALATHAAPTVIVYSPSARTIQTTEIVQTVFPEADLRAIEGLYMSSPDEIEQYATQANGDVTLVIAHNPGLKDLSRWYVSGGEGHDRDGLAHLEDGFPTACASVFSVEERPARGRATLTGFVTPHQTATSAR